MRSFFHLATASLALLLSACSPSAPVKAVLVDGRVTFVGDTPDGRKAPCPQSFAILAEDGGPAWRIDQAGPWEGPGCAFRFPATYGQPPAGFAAAQAPQPLEPGRLYVILGDGGLHGAFSFQKDGADTVIRNVDAGSAQAQEIRRRHVPSATD
ncbi:hypothetical protein [Allosphingosinicella vermicomposti]|uniref:hypothetical protein n=1 Tax=Allosphingosinicella vermicomposti TaxID=614671 RepID=UPI00131A57AC|nr:hypothetical protein [Allosphingosinicella vermicomposti]